MRKRVIGLFLCMVLLLACSIKMSPIASAEAKSGNDEPISSLPNEADVLTAPEYFETIITDPEEIKKIAAKENLENPDNIIDIKYIYTYNTNTTTPNNLLQDNAIKGSITTTVHIDDKVDLGGGFYYEDQYDENRYDGPLNASRTYTRSSTTGYNASVSIPLEIFKLEFGYNDSETVTTQDVVSLSVAEDEYVILKVHTNYQMQTFNVYYEYSDVPGLWYNQGAGKTWKPIGLIFLQTRYKK